MKRFFIADTHFGHEFLIKNELRPFKSVEEMNEIIIANWNKTVNSCDKVYCVGDIVFGKKNLPILDRLNGKKILIKGNHDIYDLEDYAKYFLDIRGAFEYQNIIITHIPIHEFCIERYKFNIHGHLHKEKINHKKYINVCVENINYTPIEYDQIIY